MGQLAIGTVATSSTGDDKYISSPGATQGSTAAAFPSIINTRLDSSPELQNYYWDWDNNVPGGGDPTYQSTTFTASADSPPLARQLEQLLTNLTLALLTNPSTSSSALLRWHPINVYAHNAIHLWLSYGIGFLITLVVVIFGYTAVSANGYHAIRPTGLQT